jgi:hypothetical protein
VDWLDGKKYRRIAPDLFLVTSAFSAPTIAPAASFFGSIHGGSSSSIIIIKHESSSFVCWFYSIVPDNSTGCILHSSGS